MTETTFRIFHRTWWTPNPSYPDGLEPSPGKKKFVGWADTYEDARDICRAWNASHQPGRLSDKAEFEERI